jgi:hypothetical protein
VYSKGDLVNIRPTFSSRHTIGIIIDIDPEPTCRLRYMILARGFDRLLWYMETEITGYVVEKEQI